MTDHGVEWDEEFLGCPIVVDPTLPPDTISVVSGDERVDIKVTPDGTWARHHVDIFVVGKPDETPEPEFTVEDIFVIKDRGPVITRSKEAAAEWPGRDEPGSFNTGDWIECGSLRAQITGLEYFCIPGPQSQQSMLLRGVEREQLEAGQTWVRGRP